MSCNKDSSISILINLRLSIVNLDNILYNTINIGIKDSLSLIPMSKRMTSGLEHF